MMNSLDNSKFFKTAVLPLLFFVLTPAVIGLCIYSLFTLGQTKIATPIVASAQHTQTSSSGVSIFAALPDISPNITNEINAKDARVEILKQYLISYDSPLAPFAEKIVKEADKYDVDFRLITSIAQQESNLCKKIPPESFNCWGWGIHSKGSLGFSSFEEGIEVVTAGLKSEYIDKGYTTVDEIMSKYTPSSPGTWARGVNTFMTDME